MVAVCKCVTIRNMRGLLYFLYGIALQGAVYTPFVSGGDTPMMALGLVRPVYTYRTLFQLPIQNCSLKELET